MKYWMDFAGQPSLSDSSFLGKDLNISELKERFNTHFVKGVSNTVKITFLGNRVNRSFIAGFRGKSIVICDMTTKKEYSPREFSQELTNLENILSPRLVN